MPLIQVVSQSRTKINPGSVKNAAKLILNALGYTESELSILIVDDEEMERLNRQYRGTSRTTDVLSFPMLEGEFSEIAPEMLGDVAISAQTAGALSEETGTSFGSVLELLLIHGILHLIGFDHEDGSVQAERMKLKTKELFAMLGHCVDELGWFLGVDQEDNWQDSQ